MIATGAAVPHPMHWEAFQNAGGLPALTTSGGDPGFL
jgi:hypothetical protein